MPTFSNFVRNEITRQKNETREENISQLFGIIKFGGSLMFYGNNKLSFKISTDNSAVARKIFILFKKCFNQSLTVIAKKNNNIKHKTTYTLQFDNGKNVNEVLEKLGIIKITDGNISIRNDIKPTLIDTIKKKKAFIKGAFQGSGSIANPEKSYHLEFVLYDEPFAKEFNQLLNEFGIKSNIIERKDSTVIYIKESDSISDLLNLMKAHESMFKLEDIKIKKQMRNDVNRLVNCETANLSKTVKTFVRQKDSILYIKEKKGLNYLPDDLREIAELRLKYEEYSLKQLAEIMSEPITKSGVNYRLKKIEKIAEKLKKEEL